MIHRRALEWTVTGGTLILEAVAMDLPDALNLAPLRMPVTVHGGQQGLIRHVGMEL